MKTSSTSGSITGMEEKRYLGTCQACFRQQMVKPRGRGVDPILVLHGYQRPGTGETIGRCPGVGHLPFELSCEYTKEYRDAVRRGLAGTKESLSDLTSGKTKTLLFEVRDRERQRTWGAKQPMKLIEIGPGWKGESYWETWEKAVESRAGKLRTYISAYESELSRLDRRIAGWVYSPQALKKPEPPKVSATAEGSAWYFSKETEALMKSLPAPSSGPQLADRRDPSAGPPTNLRTWIERQRPMMAYTSMRGTVKPSFYDMARARLADAQGRPRPAPVTRRGAPKPEKAPTPVSKKQAALLADLVAKGGEGVYQDEDRSSYYTGTELEYRKMTTWEFLDPPPTYGVGPRRVKIKVTDEGRKALDRYQSGDTMSARMAAKKAAARTG